MHAQRVPGNKRLNLDRDGFDAPMSPPFAHGGEGYAACSRTLSTLRGLLGQSLVWQNWRVSIWTWFSWARGDERGFVATDPVGGGSDCRARDPSQGRATDGGEACGSRLACGEPSFGHREFWRTMSSGALRQDPSKPPGSGAWSGVGGGGRSAPLVDFRASRGLRGR